MHWDVTNMLKYLWNVEAVTDGITTNAKKQQKEIKKLYPKEPHYICKREKTQSQ